MNFPSGPFHPFPDQQSPEASTLMRTFVFQREQTHQSIIIDLKINANFQTIDLSSVFQQYCPIEHHKISVYDPEANKFVTLNKSAAEGSCLLPLGLLEANVVMVRFRKQEQSGQNMETDSGVESGAESGRDKKDRSRERTIGEVIQVVKKWRRVHLQDNRTAQKKVSLAEAAMSIGVSKKSLDDYYYQLRLGEYYNFDFANCLSEKVGILRAFVKAFRPERQQKNRNIRHPKNLKIIEQFDIQLPNVLQETPDPSSTAFSQLKSPTSFKSLSLCEQDHPSQQNPFIRDLMTTYQDKFFKNFEFLLDDPNDPFIQIDPNFKKKNFHDQKSEFFFF